MSDDLRSIFQKAGKSDAFFEGKLPVDLWRAQSDQDFKKEVFIMQPHPGYVKRNDRGEVIKERLPDVKIVDRDGKMIVLGCRCIKGEYRGISLYDVTITWLGPKWQNYMIPAGTLIPPGLMVTRDHYLRDHQATHYTLGPKDDMPLELFIQTLKVVAQKAVLITGK